MVMPGSATANVKEFLRLHQDLINLKPLAEIDFSQVERVILVDTHQVSRTGELYPKLKEYPNIRFHIYDHHPVNSERDERVEKEVILPRGAATTLLVEALQQEDIDLTPFEATLLAMGIYEDTGNLSYSSTTFHDAGAVAILIKNGADLKTVGHYVNFPLTHEQRQLSEYLLSVAEVQTIRGMTIVIAQGKWPTFLEGLSVITQKLMETENAAVAVSIVQMKDKTFIVGRSQLPAIKVNRLLERFGGGGHWGAAAAWTLSTDVDRMAAEILDQIRQLIPPEPQAADLMSKPVRTFTADGTIEEAWQRMIHYGHSAIVVVENERVKGILSRKDADRALQMGLKQEPVKKWMSRNLHAVERATPLHTIHQMMIEKDVGRILVMEGKNLEGIITRTDLLRALHPAEGAEGGLTFFSPLVKVHYPPQQEQMIRNVGEVAENLQMEVYLVGGCVRDMIIGALNPDIDMAVEGDALRLAEAIKEKTPEIKIKPHERYGTVSLHYPDGSRLDLATARTEYYPYAGAQPVVEASSLKQDLYRRDFTINGLAMRVNPRHYGELIDFFGGTTDIQNGTLRVLHNLSFMEDPIRILRAVRFEMRLKFQMEHQTLELAHSAAETGTFDDWEGDRIKQEMKYALSGPLAYPYFARLKDLGALRILASGLADHEPYFLERVRQIQETLEWYRHLPGSLPAEEWLLYLFEMVQNVIMNEKEPVPKAVDRISERLRLAGYKRRLLRTALAEKELVIPRLLSADRPSQRYFLLKEYPPEVILYWLSSSELEMQKSLTEYLEKDRDVKLNISGDDLIALGLKPGPAFHRILQKVLEEKLDDPLMTKEEEFTLARALVSGSGRMSSDA